MPFCSFAEGAAMFGVTPIENMFLLEYLPQLPDDCVRVYLYARMLCHYPEMGGGLEEIAKALHLDNEAVLDAFHCLEQQGLVEKMSDRPPTYSFLPLNKGVVMQENTVDRRNMDFNFSILKTLDVTSIGSKQSAMLHDWLDVLGYTQEAALKILEYEKKVSGHYTVNTIIKRADKRAIDWAERGIHTLEDVNRAISYDDQVYATAYAVLKQLAITRKPTDNELDCVRRWVHEWELSQQDVLSACVHTTKSRNPSIAYLDAILKEQAGGGNPNFKTMKAILQGLGAAHTTPTPDQLNKFSALLQQGFESEVILMAAVQCANKGWHNFDKLEWMLNEWSEAGVHTRGQAEAYLANMQLMRDELRALYKTAGLSRAVYANDIKLYEAWKQKYSQDMILCAAQCALAAREPTKYMNKLLTEWEKANIVTPEAALQQHKAYQLSGAAPAAMPRHLNYQQHAVTEEEYGRSSYADPTKDLE